MPKKRSKQEFTKESDKIKESSREAIDKATKVADFAAETKKMLESLEGEAFSDTTAEMKAANEQLQDAIDEREEEIVEEADEVDEQFSEESEDLYAGIEGNKSDISQLKNLEKQAEKAGVVEAGIAQAEKAKQGEIAFSENEAKAIENAQKEQQKRIEEAKRKRQANRAAYGD
ncbi:hypothetical protein [Microcoleus sp. N9_A1]|uniref:hypothetical protein n=1 Tax=Microcoleus sp. N9_A1 TaxID=3055380 RepID=UPI002FD54364